MRYAAIDLDTGKVFNVVTVEDGDGSILNITHVASEDAEIGDSWDGQRIVRAEPPPPPPLKWEDLQQKAAVALNEMREVAISRMMTRGTLTVDEVDYVKKLEDIKSTRDGDPSIKFPEKP